MTEKEKEFYKFMEKSQQAIILNPDQRILYSPEDEIDLREIWEVIWKGKWLIILTTVVFGIVGALYSRTLPDVYQSSATLAASSGGGLLNATTNQAGSPSINISSFEDKIQNTKIAVESLNSRVFLKNFIHKHNLKPEILAVKAWSSGKNELVFENSIYNKQEKTWLSNGELNKKYEPSDEAAVSKLQNSLTTKLNPKNHIVTLSVKHYSPYIAQKWTQWLIEDFNRYMQKKDIENTSKGIDKLSQQLQKDALPETKKAINELIGSQRNKLVLMEITDEYAFETIDPPFLPDSPVEPKRQFILMASLLLGFFLSVLCVFILNFLKKAEV